MTAEEMDDHLPPPPPAGKPVREKKARAAGGVRRPGRPPGRTGALFLAVGLLAGFAAAYLYLDKNPSAVPRLPRPIRMPASRASVRARRATCPAAAADSRLWPPTRSPVRSSRDLEAAVAKEPKNADLLVQLGNTAYDVEDWNEGGRRLREGAQAARRRPERPHGSRSRVPEPRQPRQGARDVHEGVGARFEPLAGGSSISRSCTASTKATTKKALEILTKLKKEHPEIPALDRLAARTRAAGEGRARA